MIGTIRRHQQWLWLVIIAATILSFVYYFSPAQRNGMMRDNTGVSYNFGSINGEPITMDQWRDAEREARIFMRLNSREWPDPNTRSKELESIARQRLVINAAMDEYHISATPEAAARYTKQLLGITPDESVPPEKILETLTQLTHEGGVTLEDFDRFARHQVGQEYLVALVGMSGKLITPKEAEVFYRRENEPIEAELVSFPITNFYSTTAPSEKEIEDYYTKRQADYRVPERLQVNYIEFPASNYNAKAEKELGTNLNDRIDQEYLRENPAAFKDEAGNQLSAEAAKARIKKGFLRFAAMAEARKDAYAFLNALSQGHDEAHPYAVDDLAKAAKTNNFAVRTTKPFDIQNPPKELPVNEKSLHLLFSMRADDPEDKDHSMIYVMSPLEGTNAYYVAGLLKRIPSQVQPLSEVHDKVVADYRQNEALEKAKAAGTRFQSALESGMNQGKTFDTMCAAQFVRPKKLTPFSLTTQSIPDLTDKSEFEMIQEYAGKMHEGQATPFIPVSDGGFLLYIKGRLPVDEAALKRDLPIFLDRMRERLQVAAFQEWFGMQYHLHFTAPLGETPPASGG